MSAIDDALEANRRFVSTFEPPETPPAPKLALVLCMDARIDPIRVLGLKPGHAHIIRNAGGRVADALRSLVVSQRVIGTEELAIIHHTECGMATFTDREIRKRLREETGEITDHISFYPFQDLDQSVRDDIQLYRQSPLVRHDIPVRGFVYEVGTGQLREVI
ncbi:MAG: beta-class carbonic anhydrase [Tepidiformaceae bacterium]